MKTRGADSFEFLRILVPSAAAPLGALDVRSVFRSDRLSAARNLAPSETAAWRAVARVLRSPLDALACALLPAGCRLCGDPLLRLSRVPVCDSCLQIPLQSQNLCPCCGEFLAGQSETLCDPCRMVPPPFTQAVAWGLYTGRTRELVHLFKYSGLLGLSHTLGRRVAEAANLFSNLPKEFTVTPVPLYRGKQRTRGFNQAALLAGASIRPMRELFPAHRIQLDERMLSRVRATESQAGLSPAERRRNLRAAFFVPKPERARGKHILLVDDIYTSGATARGCAEALLKAGALSVRVVTLSRAQREMAVHWDGMKEERQEAAAVF